MRRRVLCQLLGMSCMASLQSATAGDQSPHTSPLRREATQAAPSPLVSGMPQALKGHLGFRSLYYLMNRNAWPPLLSDGHSIKAGAAEIGLDNPRQIIVIYNAWHLPGAPEDIRLTDLRKHALRPSVVFVDDWPKVLALGFIVLVEKRSGEWALVANLGRHYLIEDRSGIGVFPI